MNDPIKAKIQELCPDVMKKSFGYQVRVLSNSAMGDEVFKKFGERLFWLGGENLKYYCSKGWIDFQMVGELEHKSSIEHLGLPITLAVVLRAIGKTTKETSYFVDSDGSFHEWFAPKGRLDLRTVARWNLEHDNYDQQSEETKAFIGSLLLN